MWQDQRGLMILMNNNKISLRRLYHFSNFVTFLRYLDLHQISPSVNGVVSTLLSEDWQQRPSAEQILFSSFPTMTICDWRTTLPLQEYVSDMYEYLAEFYQA